MDKKQHPVGESKELSAGQPFSSSSLQQATRPSLGNPERMIAVTGAIVLRAQELLTGHELLSEGALIAILVAAFGSPAVTAAMRAFQRFRK